MQLRYWLLSIRLPVLILGIGPILLGFAIAFPSLEAINWLLNAAIVLSVLCIQIATHFFNDALDFLKEVDSSSRKGPKRAVQMGYISPTIMVKLGSALLLVAGLAGLYLVLQGGWLVFILGVISLSLAYLYTGGPYPLSSTGLSDLFVLLFFGLLPAIFTFYLNTGYWEVSTVIAGLQCGFLSLNILIVNHLRDIKEDTLAGRRSLVVRFGASFGRMEWLIVRWIPYLLGFYWVFQQNALAAFLPFVLLPFSFWLQCLLWQAASRSELYNTVLIRSCLYYLLFILLLVFSFLY